MVAGDGAAVEFEPGRLPLLLRKLKLLEETGAAGQLSYAMLARIVILKAAIAVACRRKGSNC